jgi:hypothetical protein
VRTLRDLSLFEAAVPAEAGAPDDDTPPDIDEFRHELARRIHALIDAQQAQQGQEQGAAD